MRAPSSVGSNSSAERAALAEHFAIAALEYQPRPQGTNVAEHLFGTDEESRQPLRRPFRGQFFARIRTADKLPHRRDHAADDHDREKEEQPLAGRPMRCGDRHSQQSFCLSRRR